MFESIRPFLISFAIGMIIGIERERAHPVQARAMGVRTFTLVALLGTFAHELHSTILLALVSSFVFALIIYGFYTNAVGNHEHPKRGITTELAAGVVFCLGYLAVENPFLSVAVALTVLIILFGRKSLHEFAREELRPKEIQATIIILVMTLLVLSFLPDHAIDPWGLFNPRQFGMLILFVSLVQFGGYVAVRLFGENFGIGLVGFFAGIASSTAVFATLPGLSKENPNFYRSFVVAGILAQIGTMLLALIILMLMAQPLFQKLLGPVLLMMGVGLGGAFLLMNKQHPTQLIALPKNPLDLRAVLRLSIFIALLLCFAIFIQNHFSAGGIGLVTFIGALFALPGATIANATLYSSGKISLASAAEYQFYAIAATYCTKYILLLMLGRNRFGFLSGLFLSAMLMSGFILAHFIGFFSHFNPSVQP